MELSLPGFKKSSPWKLKLHEWADQFFNGKTTSKGLPGIKKRRSPWKVKLHKCTEQLFNGKTTSKAPISQLEPVYWSKCSCQQGFSGSFFFGFI